MGLSERAKNWLYMGHSFIIWAGSLEQIWHIWAYRSAQDLTLFWIVCLFASELVALPRALASQYWVWKLCHIVGSCLMVALLLGVIKYG